ncbi:MAG: universal stress protein [Acidobacteria bacterium]|nr:universal stress protein [Acidobacteriota bacterium]MBV9479035.1 universal stress protein [Acidobacteriota bacterium]
MFHRLLIPTDFSTASEWVFDDAVRIAAADRAELLILHVRMTWPSHPQELRFKADPSLYEYVEQSELDRLRDRVRRANSSVATRLIVRQAPGIGDEIAHVAKDEGVDLIVIATHARHHVAHLFVGSTTRSVLDAPPAPVLAIRYGIRRRTDVFGRVVVPVHLDQTAHTALDLAKQVAKELHLVTVCDGELRSRAEAHLQQIAQTLPNATIAIVTGKRAEEEIVSYAEKRDIDAIFLNAKGALSEGKLDIVRHANVPVMIVP